jgi:hypothetical protein
MGVATTPRTRRRAGPVARRFGYLVAVAVNLAVLFLANRWPGWDAVPFLTDETEDVIGIFNVSVVVSAAANALYFVFDRQWLKAIGDLVTTVFGVVVMVAVWRVWPFDFDDDWSGWGLLFHLLLLVGIVGSAIAVLTTPVKLARLRRATD